MANEVSYPTRTMSPAVSKHPWRLSDGRWELGSECQTAMIKSAPTMVKKLGKNANYDVYKAWSSAVDDWVLTHTQVYPESLGPSAVRSVSRMTLDPELYAALEGDGALGGRQGSSENPLETKWEAMMEHLRDRLGCSAINLKLGLATLR